MKSLFADKVAIVTGSSRGIGKAIALDLAKAGCSVITNTNTGEELVAAREVAEECRTFGVETLAVRADISRLSDVKRLFAATHKKFGRLDVLVNNAAAFHVGEAMELEERDWYRVFEVNCKGTLFCSREAARRMKLTGEGSIVNISSLGSVHGWPGMVVYCSSKGAINAMTHTLACEWAPHNIRVNAVAPGHAATPHNLDFFARGKKRDWMRNRIALGRLGKLEEIAQVVTFLASPASSYLTGQVIYVEGGLMSWQGFREER